MKRYKRVGLRHCFYHVFCLGVCILSCGCGTTNKSEFTSLQEIIEKDEPYLAQENLEEQEMEDATEEEVVEVGEKIDWEDLDGNGEQEYFIITNDEKNGTLFLYFNNELIYQYEDQYLWIVGISEKEYIDLDNDGEQEIFVSFIPNVNSMPLVEWFVLKKEESGWEPMEMYHENNDMTQNAFPISIVLKEKDYELSITCEDCEKEIVYDATYHYEKEKEDKNKGNYSSYDTFVGSDFEVGDTVGTTSAWGIWDIQNGIYKGQNCLIAVHGLNGPDGKYDFYGYLDVYFCYDDNAKIKILDIVFREKI